MRNRWPGTRHPASFFCAGLATFLLAGSTPEAQVNQCVPAPPGLVAWYPFDQDGSDIIGGLDGTLLGGASIVPLGQVEGAVSLDGSSGRVGLPDNAFAALASGTIVSWIFADTLSDPDGEKTFFSALGTISGIQNNLDFAVEVDGRLRMVVRPNAGELLDVLTTSPVIGSGGWHHVAYVSDASGNRLYLDGSQLTSLSYAFGNATTQAFFSNIAGLQKTFIGVLIASDGTLKRFWDGELDEVTIFSRALSTIEIGDIFTAGPAGLCKDEDEDGFRPPQDCDETNAAINPGATELPGNFVDENCNGDLGTCSPCSTWRSHGEFVRCVAEEVESLVIAGILSEDEGDALVGSAARSDIGKRGFVPPECQP